MHPFVFDGTRPMEIVGDLSLANDQQNAVVIQGLQNLHNAHLELHQKAGKVYLRGKVHPQVDKDWYKQPQCFFKLNHGESVVLQPGH